MINLSTEYVAEKNWSVMNNSVANKAEKGFVERALLFQLQLKRYTNYRYTLWYKYDIPSFVNRK